MAFFFNKSQPSKPLDEYRLALITYLTTQEAKTFDIVTLNELARQKSCWDFAYYGTLGFNTETLTPILTAQVSKNAATKVKKITEKQWQEEFSSSQPQKSVINGIITSNERYFNLYIKPTDFFLAKTEATESLPQTEVYQKDKQTGAFVLQTVKDFLYACYRLDLARHPQLEETNLPFNQLQPKSLLGQVADFLHRIATGSITEVDVQYSFTWLLQYASTITATSTLYASYSSAALPTDIQEQTEAIMEKLVTEFTTINVTQLNGTADSLAISHQLLEEIPRLFQEANKKMTKLDHRLSEETTSLPPDKPK